MRARYILVPLILTASISSCSFSTAEPTKPTPSTALTTADCPGTLIENPDLADALHTVAASLPAHVSIGGGALETSAGNPIAIVQLCAPDQSDDANSRRGTALSASGLAGVVVTMKLALVQRAGYPSCRDGLPGNGVGSFGAGDTGTCRVTL
ncbi:hypothetical protein [Rhodococcus qingshengii]|uniref:hypothetical protein n=1 Tax=Rhodococcus qingshengii TaxID=334542 RepID=UPI003672C6DA